MVIQARRKVKFFEGATSNKSSFKEEGRRLKAMCFSNGIHCVKITLRCQINESTRLTNFPPFSFIRQFFAGFSLIISLLAIAYHIFPRPTGLFGPANL